MKKKIQIAAWSLFDFANTSYSIVVVTFAYAVYFKQVVFEGEPIGDFFWSLGVAISLITSALLSPILGAIADYSSSKKFFLGFFTILCFLSTASLYFVSRGDYFFAVFLFILANIGFECGLVFYDAFLPEIAEKKDYGKISGFGFAAGYAGAFASLLIIYPFISGDKVRLSFPISALFFFVFAIPIFLLVPEQKKFFEKNISYFKVGYNRVKNTLKNISDNKNIVFFLIAYFFYIEGVNTIIVFSGNYASASLGFTTTDLTIFFLITQTSAVAGAILFGYISDWIGPKKSLYITLLIWFVSVLFAFLTNSKDDLTTIWFAELFKTSPDKAQINVFYGIGLMVGSVMGATQSISRSFLSSLIPLEKKTEFFGFFSFFGKGSAAFGPLVFGIISSITGQQRYAILSVLFFFALGAALLYFVKENAYDMKNTK